MKKIVYLLLVSVLLFSLFSICSNTDKKQENSNIPKHLTSNNKTLNPEESNSNSNSSTISTPSSNSYTSNSPANSEQTNSEDIDNFDNDSDSSHQSSDTNKPKETDIRILQKQAEALSIHLHEYNRQVWYFFLDSLYHENEVRSLSVQSITDESILDFVTSAGAFGDLMIDANTSYYEIVQYHPYRNFANTENPLLISEDNAKLIAYEFFGKEDWFFKDNLGFYYWDDSLKVYAVGEIGRGIETFEYSYATYSVNHIDSSNTIEITFNISFSFYLDDYLKEYNISDYEAFKNSKAKFIYEIINSETDSYAFLRLKSIDFTAIH